MAACLGGQCCSRGDARPVDSRVGIYPFALGAIIYGVLLLRSTGAFNRVAGSLPSWYRKLFFNPFGVPAGSQAFLDRLRLVGAGFVVLGAIAAVLVTVAVVFHLR